LAIVGQAICPEFVFISAVQICGATSGHMLIAALRQICEIYATSWQTAQMGAAERNFRVADFVGQVLEFLPR
jgi:poly-beta-hydroxyalkanoate depolymerase